MIKKILLSLLLAVSCLHYAEGFVIAPHGKQLWASSKQVSAIRNENLKMQSNNDNDDDILTRRQAMRESSLAVFASSVVALNLIATPAYADIYDDQRKEQEAKSREDAEKNKQLIPLVLGGGLVLSLPFFSTQPFATWYKGFVRR